MQKHIKIAIILLCLIFPLLCFSLYQNGKNFYAMSRGNYFFQNTRNNTHLASIALEFNNGSQITLVLREGLWKVKEADDYFVSYSQISELMDFITSSVIYRADPIQKMDIPEFMNGGIKIFCKDDHGELLDFAVVAPKSEANRYHYALLNDLPYLYQIRGDFVPSNILMDWVKLPLLDIEENSIQRIDTNNFQVYRRFFGDELKLSETDEPSYYISQLTDNFQKLYAEEIKHITNFNLNDVQKVKHYDIALLNGLTYEIDVYSDETNYWLNIRLNKALIADDFASKTLEESRILYEGWFFKIDSNKGHIISNFVI